MPEHTSPAAAAVAIAGAGPVAQALGRALRDCGIRIACVGSRNLDHAKCAAEFIGGEAIAVSYRDIPMHASHVIVAVSDAAIALVAGELAAQNGQLRIALHTCGAYGAELLAPLKSLGVSCGGLHPLETIRDPAKGAAALRHAFFSVCGDPAALTWSEGLARLLSACVLHISDNARPLYHAAAVMASNYLAALMDSAEQLMILAGVAKADALRALAPLVRTSMENVFQRGPVQALTGPIVRGDDGTITEHSKALACADPTIAALYEAAGLHALQMARRRGLPDEEAERIRQALLRRR